MSDVKNYVRLDDHGAYRVGQTKISLDSVVYGYKHGQAAESIAEDFPDLTLEEVNGAIAFFLNNRQLVEDYLVRQNELWRKLRAEADKTPSPVVERLRAIRDAEAKVKS